MSNQNDDATTSQNTEMVAVVMSPADIINNNNNAGSSHHGSPGAGAGARAVAAPVEGSVVDPGSANNHNGEVVYQAQAIVHPADAQLIQQQYHEQLQLQSLQYDQAAAARRAAAEQEEDDGNRPPTRRVLFVAAIYFICAILSLVAALQYVALPKKPGDLRITMWKTCATDAQFKSIGCEQTTKYDKFCPEVHQLFHGVRAMVGITILVFVIGASLAISTFVGAAWVSQNRRGVLSVAGVVGAMCAIVTVALVAAFLTRNLCAGKSSGPVAVIDHTKFETGASIALISTAAALAIVGVLFSVLPMECCEETVNTQEMNCCANVSHQPLQPRHLNSEINNNQAQQQQQENNIQQERNLQVQNQGD